MCAFAEVVRCAFRLRYVPVIAKVLASCYVKPQIELEFQHGVLSFFEFCQHDIHSKINVTIIQPAAQPAAHNATAAHTTH